MDCSPVRYMRRSSSGRGSYADGLLVGTADLAGGIDGADTCEADPLTFRTPLLLQTLALLVRAAARVLM
jgi:hypothetical protein